jgi:hypothetical protein
MNALLLAVALLAPADAREPRSVDDILASFKDEPEVREVQEMVLAYSKTDPAYVDAWLRASVTAAWLPELQFTYDYDNGYDRDYNYLTSQDAGFDGASEAEIEGSGVDLQHGVQVRARWELDKLVMSSERIRVISEAQDVVKLRDKVLEEVTRLYFDRRRLQVDMMMTDGDAKTQLKNELRLQELTAQLDAYTGGRFSGSLKSKGR